jgi:hypothetical protein
VNELGKVVGSNQWSSFHSPRFGVTAGGMGGVCGCSGLVGRPCRKLLSSLGLGLGAAAGGRSVIVLLGEQWFEFAPPCQSSPTR